MPPKKYLVHLSDSERCRLNELTCSGRLNPRQRIRAQVLLKADDGLKDAEIACALNTSPSTVERTRKRFVEGGLEQALNDAPRPGQRHKLDLHSEAVLLAIAGSPAPAGHDHWSTRLLADWLVELGLVESISPETVRAALNKRRQGQVRPNAAIKQLHRRTRGRW